ncbi:DNA-protecting protein DprA [Aquimarina sp. TRL1]|uniref:DNA-processing protein DprA n=1 Tax=Aquimarina sp. (strain TRL1) TaxID=2736252 RepID=UPI00158CFC81|nr:DNA-processing protein DprA [Aquimarina sp. TRL1]QKX04751.1 DNA-protecting protein DprA [Aquimarina sp. TRL1]
MEEKLKAVMILKKAANLGDSSIKKMIQAVGSAEGVLKEKAANLLKIEGIGSQRIHDIQNPAYEAAVEEELCFIRNNAIDCYLYDAPDYPYRLKQCLDGPVLLFGRGNICMTQKNVISIVGTRRATSYGIRFCEELIEMLAPLDPIIVSGFAYGIDITAQRAALNAGLQTIGCLAHGLNQLYPKTHKKYTTAIEENGGFFTDYWSTDLFDRKNFLGRNRIIAGISEATVVIESANKGGSLVTAELAHSYNRDVFAVPGRVTDVYSQGCNMLIKTQKAHVLTTAADLIYMLNWELEEKQQQAQQKQLFVTLDEEEKTIFHFLENNNKELLDHIALHCHMPTFKVASLLLTMELKGVVRPLPGKRFELI